MGQEASNLIYEIDHQKKQINVKEQNNILITIPIEEISSKLETLLNRIKKGSESKRVFEIFEVQEIMSELRIKKLKSPSQSESRYFHYI